jgi:hypothetical protein
MKLRLWGYSPLFTFCLSSAICAVLPAGPAHAQDAEALRARHAALEKQLASNPFGRPLVLESAQDSSNSRGEIYAEIKHRYVVLLKALRSPKQWCDILILQPNVKYCDAAPAGPGDRLTLLMTRKNADQLDSAVRVDFRHQVAIADSNYLHVALDAPTGPFGTSNYRIELEAAALDGQRSFLHLSYSYSLSMRAKLAMQGYLATAGRNKVGFSIVGQRADGSPVYVRGVRGMIERNTMRNYLAIEAHLGTFDLLPPQQQESRLREWHAAIERYPLQLKELEREEYLAMKRREVQRMQGDKSASPK